MVAVTEPTTPDPATASGSAASEPGGDGRLDDERWHWLTSVRVDDPRAIAAAHAARRRRASLTADGSLFVVAADHPARGVLGVGADDRAMADRRQLLGRLLTALENPRVDGVLGSCDILDDLVLLGALDDKVAVATMNRGGLAGASWELDDRFTAYDADHVAGANLDAGKMLLRIDRQDPDTAPTLDACAAAVRRLSDLGLMALVEPLAYRRDGAGRAVWSDDPDELLAAVAVAAALGASSAYTWLKVPAAADIAAVAAVTSQPMLILGGSPGPDPERTYAGWEAALDQPTVRGLVVGRALLYPGDGDVAAAVARAAELVVAASAARPQRQS